MCILEGAPSKLSRAEALDPVAVSHCVIVTVVMKTSARKTESTREAVYWW